MNYVCMDFLCRLAFVVLLYRYIPYGKGQLVPYFAKTQYVYLLYYSIDFQKFSTMFFFVEQHYCIPLSSTTTVLKFVDIHLSLIVLTMHCIVHCIVLNHMIDFITVCKFSSSLVSLQVPFDWCLSQEFYVSYLTSKRDTTLSNRGRAY